MEKLVAFFSSDARPLYRADIYRTLALPAGFVIHFRYQDKYVDDTILSKLSDYKGSKGIIFSTIGNDLSIEAKDRVLEDVSVRRVVIEAATKDPSNNSMIHFYLRLGEFADATVSSGRTQGKFADELTVKVGNEGQWSDRVELVQRGLGDLAYIHVNGMLKDGVKVTPSYNHSTRQSYYSLEEDQDYSLELSLLSTSGEKSEVGISIVGGDLRTNIHDKITLGAPRDLRNIAIGTPPIASRSSYSNIKLHDHSNSDYSVEMEVKVERGIKRPALFGLLTILIISGVIVSQFVDDNLSGASFAWPNFILALVAVALSSIGAGLLYWIFNKK